MNFTKLVLLALSIGLVIPYLAGCDEETPEQKAAYEAAQKQRAASRPGNPQSNQPGVAPGTEENAGR